MKIDFLIPNFSQGGAQRQCAMLLNSLASRSDIEARLLYFSEGENFDLLNEGAFEIRRMHSHSFYSAANVVRVLSLVKQRRPDILFSWLPTADVYAGFCKLALSKQTKWLMAERDSGYPANWRYSLRKRLAPLSDAIVCNSEMGKNYWINNDYPRDRINVVPNIVLPGQQQYGENSSKEWDIVFAGRLEPQKNIEVLAEAFCVLSSRRSDVRLAIIGDGSLRKAVQKTLQSHGVEDKVLLLPYDPNIGEVFAKNLIFVNISHHEGLPNTVVENIALGNCIVASCIPEHVDLLGESYPFFVDNFTDSVAVADTLESALDAEWNPENLKVAQSKISQMAPTVVAERYLEVFKSLLSQDRLHPSNKETEK